MAKGFAALVLATLVCSPLGATALAPFIDLQEAGLTLVEDGAGLEARAFPVSLDVNIGGTVRFALLYWAGSQQPCTLDGTGTSCPFTQPYLDQQMIFDGTAITGTVIGTETWPTAPAKGTAAAGARLSIGYFADVTSLVAAAGTGNQSFTFEDGNAASNLWDLDGVSLMVAFTDAGDPASYRVLVWDGLDFADGDATLPENQTTGAVTFAHGANPVARTAQLFLIGGDGDAAEPDQVTISNNPTLFNVFDSTPDGNQWQSDETIINIPAAVSSTAVQVQSPATAGADDDVLWEVALLRIAPNAPPTCPRVVFAGPPSRVEFTVQDADSGLVSLVVTLSENADTLVPPFIPGSTDPVVVTSTKIDQAQPMRIEFLATDADGASTECGYFEGTVTIEKDTVPDAPQDFVFSGSGGIGSFSLDDDADGTLPATRSFIVEAGSYTVSEAAVAGYQTSLSCTDPSGGTTTDPATRTANIELAAAPLETVACTFTNTALPDLEIVKSATASNVGMGQTFDFLLAVTNHGPGAATNVVVSDTLPPQVAFVSSNCGATALGQVVTWNIGAMASGATAPCSITVQVVALGPITNTATVSAAEIESDESNNSSTVSLQANIPIPTLSEWAAALFALLLMAAGARLLRQ